MPEDIPQKLRPFVSLGFDYSPSRKSGNEAYGDCIFCGKTDKLYINMENGKFSCKAGHCNSYGNTYTFFQKWYELFSGKDMPFKQLENDREIPAKALQDSGLIWDGLRWALPVLNVSGAIVNFRFYTQGQKMMGLPTMELGIWGVEELYNEKRLEEIVYVCEGEWDAIATQQMLKRSYLKGTVVAVPGCSVFKAKWAQHFRGRHVVLCFDHDIDGEKGTRRVHSIIKGEVETFKWVKWPDRVPEHFDMRDFYINNGTIEGLDEWLEAMEVFHNEDDVEEVATANLPAYSSGKRPLYPEILAVYKTHLFMTQDMEDALKIVLAVVLSNQIEGDPLWLHIAGVPGSGKTELLLSVSGSAWCHFESSLTPHSLVSGWQGKGEADPSLLSKLDGKVLVLKDFTEVLMMARGSRDEIYSTLRGAFDGHVIRGYGNGVVRKYDTHFNLITGVTQSIFGIEGASLGERFLIYHLIKGVGFDADDQIFAALNADSTDNRMRTELMEAGTSFLNYAIEPGDVPQLGDKWTRRLVHLSQFVSMLRAGVQRDFSRDRLIYRAQHEMGTRIAKQLKKLLLGLSLINYPASIDDGAYRIATRVALDTCIGFNLEIVQTLFKNDGLIYTQLSDACSIPMSTLRSAVEDMEQLGILRKEKMGNPAGLGGPVIKWYLTEVIKRHWFGAGLNSESLPIEQISSSQKDAFSNARIRRAGTSKYGESNE